MLPKIVYYPVLWLVLFLEKLYKNKRMLIYGRPGTEEAEDVYLVRYVLLPKHWSWNIYIHRFLRSDHDVPHDHPFDFVGLVLSGGYREIFKDHRKEGMVEQYNPPGSFIIRTGSHIHQVLINDKYELSDYKKAPLTVILRGPRYQPWGFWSKKGWVEHREYLGLDKTTD